MTVIQSIDTILAWSIFSNTPPRNLTKLMQLHQWHGNGQHERPGAGYLQSLWHPWLVDGQYSNAASVVAVTCCTTGGLEINNQMQPSLMMMNTTTTRLATTMMGTRNPQETKRPRPPILHWLLQLFIGANWLPHIVLPLPLAIRQTGKSQQKGHDYDYDNQPANPLKQDALLTLQKVAPLQLLRHWWNGSSGGV